MLAYVDRVRAGVGVYVRSTQRKDRDGSIVRCIQLVHNRRVDGRTQAEVLLNLGREDRLDADGLRRLVRSISRYLGEPDAGDDVGGLDAGEGLSIVSSRPMGVAWLLDRLGRQLGVDTALVTVLGAAGSPPMSNGSCSLWSRTGD